MTHVYLQSGKALAAAALAALSVSTPLLADDHKLYPGSTCRSVSTGFEIDESGVGPGAIQNASFVRSVTVQCPIIRDYMASDSGVRRVRVWFHNNNTDRPITCRFETRHRDGTPVRRVFAATPTGARQGVLVLENGSRAGVGRSFHLVCTLPPTVESFRNPRIDAFRVEEFD